MKHLFLLLTLLATAPCLRAEARVTDVWAAQIPGTHQVRITYKLDAAGPCTVRVQAWLDVPGTSLVLPDASLSGDVTDEDGVKKISPGTGKSITLTVSRTTASGGTTWLAPSLQNTFTKNLRFKVLATESSGPLIFDDMVFIPAGEFQMGDQSNPPIGHSNELPVHTVNHDAFYIGKYEVSWAHWKKVRDWARQSGLGYTDLPDGAGKADDHPVHSISWYEMVKWCNALTEYENAMMGQFAMPCYKVNGVVYRSGNFEPSCDWSASGYRLPTEAEWEKAARGGLNGNIFPWGNTNTISHDQANYVVYSSNGATNEYPYDVTSRPPATGTHFFHPSFSVGGFPYTAPVNSFAPNGYGLYNMAGNVWEWCWDWFGENYYSDATANSNPRGPEQATYRIYRGGGWNWFADGNRCSFRYPIRASGTNTHDIGFRLARSANERNTDFGAMVRISEGAFVMGDQSNPPVGNSNELPVHTVQVSTFYIGKYEVSWGLWKQVRDWGRSNGYVLNDGAGKADDHPVHSITWYDMVKWCNARTEYENATLGTTTTPCYTVNGAVYRTGDSAPDCNWTANGYRLPTEAEWEKAARGGLSGKNFPWEGLIGHSKANYYSSNYSYEDDPKNQGFHPSYTAGWAPCTAPVNSFAPNGYGLYSMSGNVWELCWDWWGSYTAGLQTDPHGAPPGTHRVMRGGCWGNDAYYCRVARRDGSPPSDGGIYADKGFRPARSSVP